MHHTLANTTAFMLFHYILCTEFRFKKHVVNVTKCGLMALDYSDGLGSYDLEQAVVPKLDLIIDVDLSLII